jgi:hypothetical protein
MKKGDLVNFSTSDIWLRGDENLNLAWFERLEVVAD